MIFEADIRRAIACKHWRWMMGMLSVTPDGMMTCRVTEFTLAIDHCMLPALTDPATLGCLLALVREAYGDLGIFVRPRRNKPSPDWAVIDGDSNLIVAAPTEAEALLLALMSAP